MGATHLINNYLFFSEHFNRTEYPGIFDQYYKILDSYLEEKDISDIPEIVAELIDAAEANITRHRFKFRREAALVDSTMMFSLFVIPASVKINTPTAEMLADQIISEWNLRHPDFSVKRGSFEDICEGFKWKFI